MAINNFSGAYGTYLTLEVLTGTVSQNIAGNTSKVRVWAKLRTNGYGALHGITAPLTIQINGGSAIENISVNLGKNSESTVFIKEYEINHNSDGSKSFDVTVKVDINTGGYGSSTVSQTVHLKTIPRASSIGINQVAIGQNMSITINRADASFKHKLRYSWYGKSGEIASNVDTSSNWTIPKDFINDLPNSTSGTGTIYVDTYSGSDKIGTQTANFTATVPDDIKPTLTGFTLTDGNAIAANIVPGGEHFIKILSDIRVNFGAASGAYGSTITGYFAEIVGKNRSTTTNGGGLGLMNYDGQVVIRARVTDSRGRTSNAIERTVTILDYFPPILKFDVARTGLNGGTLTITRTAKVAPLTVNGSQKNKMTLTFKVKPLADKSYTSDTGPAAGSWTSISELVNSPANLSGQYPANKTWEVVGKLEDRYTSTEFAAIVTTEGVVISYSQFGVSINKIWERGALDVKGDIYANDKLIQMHALTQKNGTAIYAYGKDFDQERTTGVYFKNGTENNNPARQYGWLLVLNSNNECFQMFFPSISTAEPAKRVLLAGKWSAWSTNARSDHANLKRIEWTFTGVNGVHYKRQGDLVTLRMNIRGNGTTMPVGSIPRDLVPILGSGSMLNVTVWHVNTSEDKHLQINADGTMHILDSGNKDIKTQVTWSI
ncbi:DUF859 family phage minor structural protein [uncultured Streptococcus sp.]|uniref:DUF859 family phage minor structural protein n=1 Tax=uncultured Streptococcus sp. TaxID=83427 RepID=UPI0028D5B8AE|nr:DUF859 family phage minor structural protein [uncultured Streptococcus sp.]